MIKFGERIEMLVDDYLIESVKNSNIRENEAVCVGKAVKYTGEWEQEGA